MANGIAIKDVEIKLQSLTGEEVIPISSGADEPEVVEASVLKEYAQGGTYKKPSGGIPKTDLTSGVQSSLNKADTAVQIETDPTVPSWAKAESKPSYTASEVGAVPTTRKINNKALSSDITLTATDVDALPSSTVIPDAQIQSDWTQSNTSAKDYIKNKPEIPVLPTLADVATSGDYEDLINTPTIPDITNCVQKSETAGLIKNDGTVDTNTYLTSVHEVPSGGNSGQVLKKTSGSDYAYGWGNINETLPSAYCTTSGNTATKVANCSLWTATANTYLHILIGAANTYQGALMLKVNGNPTPSGAPIYINGEISSSTNYTLPAGSYIIFYDGTNFYFNTQGKIPTATSVLASVADIPDVSNYVQKNSTSGLLKNDGTVDTTAYTTNIGTVTSVTVNGSTYSPTNGDVDLGTIGGGGGTSVQADWAQTDSTALDFIKNKPSASNFYYAAWTASSSTASGNRLTDTLVLPEGVYILNGRYPVLNKNVLTVFSLTNIKTSADQSNQSGLAVFQGGSYLPIVEILFVGQGGGEIYLQAAQAVSVTYTYLDRGYISAIKIA